MLKKIGGLYFGFVLIGLGVWHLGLLGNALANDSDKNTSPSKNQNQKAELLFDGKSFQGWKQNGNWKIAKEAFFCADVPKDRCNSLCCTKKLPSDFEVLFEWKMEKVESTTENNPETTQLNPGLLVSLNLGASGGFIPNSSYGAGIDYCISGIAIRLHTRDIDDESDLANKFKSGGANTWPAKDASNPIGEWNQGKIVNQGSKIQFWLNDKKAFEIDLKDKKVFSEDGEDTDITKPSTVKLALKEWMQAKKQGLYFSVIAPYSNEFISPHVQIRNLRIQPLEKETDKVK